MNLEKIKKLQEDNYKLKEFLKEFLSYSITCPYCYKYSDKENNFDHSINCNLGKLLNENNS